MELKRFDALHLTRVSKTPEGYLRGDVAVTRAGIFKYLKQDGGINNELRHPDDVFNPVSLETLSLIPITINHPQEFVKADNAKALSVGTVGEFVRKDEGHVVARIIVTDANAIKAIEGGKRELSLGYSAEVMDEVGTYDGERYDTRQRNIRYNHLAVVDSARAGPAARIRLDSGDAVLTQEMYPMSETLASVRLDGIDYKASPEVANALTKARADADEAQKALTASKSEADKQKARADSLEAEMKKHKDGEQARLDAAVQSRVKLVEDARTVLGAEMKADATDAELIAATIKKAWPEAKTDGQSADYLRARFDMAVEMERNKAEAKQRTAGKPADGKGTAQILDSADARKAYIDRLKNPVATKE